MARKSEDRPIVPRLFGALAQVNLEGWSADRGLRAGLGCGAPLLLAEWLAQPALTWAALIGFWVALVDPLWPPRTQLLTIALFVIGTAGGCFLAVLLRNDLWLSAAFALVWSGATVLGRVWGVEVGRAGGLVALAALIVLGLGFDESSSLRAAADLAGLSVAGGLWGSLLAVAVGRRRPDQPVRQALASVFRAEAAMVQDMSKRGAFGGAKSWPRRGAVRAAIETARAAIIKAQRGWAASSARSPHFVLLLADAERILEALLAIRELLAAIAPEAAPSEALSAMEAALIAIAEGLEAPDQDAPVLRRLDPREADNAPGALAKALRQAAIWIDSAIDRLAMESPAAASSADDSRLGGQTDGLLSELRDNLTFSSLSFRHAARFAVTGACLTLLTNGLGLDRGYWITLAAVIVLQPYPSAAWLRAAQRMGGSVGGGLAAAALAYLLRSPTETTLAIVALSVLAMTARFASYAVYILCITPMFILMIDLFHDGGVLMPTLTDLRIAYNLIGASVGLAATFLLWPSSAHRDLPRRLAEDVRSSGLFLAAALMGDESPGQMEAARRSAGLAGNNAEASLQRWSDEPGRRSHQEIAAAITVAAAARRLSDIASGIAWLSPKPLEQDDRSATRRALEAQIDEMARAIEERRKPGPMPTLTPPAQNAGFFATETADAERQLAILLDAARMLAAE